MPQLTGERTLPGVPQENYWFARHVAAYRFAAARCRGLRVLDAGCGEGYGAAIMAESAAEVVGVELVADVAAHARAAYPDVGFVPADVCDLPLDDASFDAVVSLQVVEHLPDPGRFLAETARVLRPGGQFVCATPNRLTFTPDTDTPVNVFHAREYDPGELVGALAQGFAVDELLGVHHSRRLQTLERLLRYRFDRLLLERPARDWPRWLRRVVTAVRPGDFAVRAERIEASLDLLAVATRRDA
ncbi:MAG: class I SAM-dependent methyltransferase [Egibacteraceae bacterium]